MIVSSKLAAHDEFLITFALRHTVESSYVRKISYLLVQNEEYKYLNYSYRFSPTVVLDQKACRIQVKQRVMRIGTNRKWHHDMNDTKNVQRRKEWCHEVHIPPRNEQATRQESMNQTESNAIILH